MSSVRKETLTCPKCGTRSEFEIWDSINTQENPEIRTRILDESLFNWTCPKCHTKHYITFGTLYHDVENQFMLFFDHKTDESDIHEDEFPNLKEFEAINEKYKFRYVHGIQRFKEKIFIFEEDLSDIAVELLKYFIRNDIISLKNCNPNYFIGKEIYFSEMTTDRENLIFAITDDLGHVCKRFNIGMDLYEKCLQKIVLDEKFKEKKNTIKNVCQDWIKAKLRS